MEDDHLIQLNNVKQDILSVKSNITILKTQLEALYLKEYLLKLKPIRSGNSHCIVKLISAQEDLQDYKYITKAVTVSELNISLYPLWLEMICFHPQWSTDIFSVKLQTLSPDSNSRDKEVLVDAIANTLNISYDEADKIYCYNSPRLPRILYSDYYNTNNFIIDYDKAELLEEDEYQNITFGLSSDNRMINTIKFKYILITSY